MPSLWIPSLILLLIQPGIPFQSPSGPPTQTKPPRIRVLETTDYHGDEISARTGEKWLGLYVSKTGSELLSTTVRVRRFQDLGDVTGKQTGKRVTVNGKQKPIFLVQNADFLSTGPVTTCFVGKRDLPGGTDITLPVNSQKYRLVVQTKFANDGSSGISRDDAKLVLSNGQGTQVLYRLGGKGDETEVYWNLLWAGDLDADGQLDLYVDVSNHPNRSIKKLFLSSQATGRNLVKEVASMETLGC